MGSLNLRIAGSNNTPWERHSHIGSGPDGACLLASRSANRPAVVLREDFGPSLRLVPDMKWLTVLAAIGAAALALQILIWERRGGRRRPSTRGQLAVAVLTLVGLVGAVYAAHFLGVFSVPLVAIAFVPFGITARSLILATRGKRQRAADARAAAASPASQRTRLLELAALPVFFVLVAAVVVMGLVVGTLVGPH